MTRLTLFALTGLFLVAGVAAALVGGAEARVTSSAPIWNVQSTEPVEQCVLQPHRVTHPDNGAAILVLRPDCS